MQNVYLVTHSYGMNTTTYDVFSSRKKAADAAKTIATYLYGMPNVDTFDNVDTLSHQIDGFTAEVKIDKRPVK